MKTQSHTMKVQSHNLSAFILGLAYGLERIHRIIPSTSSDLKAFLFDFQNTKSGFYFKNLFNFVNQISVHNSWIAICLKNFYANPLVEEMLIREQMSRMFEIVKKIYPEDAFNCSVINADYKRCAEDIFIRHQVSYEKIIQTIYQNTPNLGAEYQLGIIFVQKSD